MRKSSASLRNSGTYTSPGTPEYGDNNDVKGWYSERVPLGTHNSNSNSNSKGKQHIMPFYSGRALPSKWDDAERWITSPISGLPKNLNVQQSHTRPKSKSGPLGAPGLMYLSSYSPPVEGGSLRSFMAGSPLNTGVLLPDGISLQYNAYIAGKYGYLNAENCKVTELPDLRSESSIPSSRAFLPENRPNGGKEAESMVSQRDMATQMSTPDDESIIQSSPEIKSPCATQNYLKNSAKIEVRDVQVDKGTSVTIHSKKKHGPLKTKSGLSNVQNSGSSWNVTQVTRNTSKVQREEAKIIAWENLQKAKAEAAIRKLEVKIEKKKSESMDKILNKLRVAQVKAQDMRSSVTENSDTPKTSKKMIFLHKMGFLSGCLFRPTK